MLDQLFEKEIESQTFGNISLDHGLVLVDVSGSMEFPNGEYSRLQIATLVANYLKASARVEVYATSGSDTEIRHRTEKVPTQFFGTDLWLSLKAACNTFGGGGIFVDQALAYISHYEVKPSTLYIITDDQMEFPTTKFWKNRCIVLDTSKFLPTEIINRLES